jgi:hypothetical protein
MEKAGSSMRSISVIDLVYFPCYVKHQINTISVKIMKLNIVITISNFNKTLTFQIRIFSK